MSLPDLNGRVVWSSGVGLMESVVALLAEWISFGEMIKLRELSTLISDILTEWQDKETMESLEDQIWNEMNEEWAEYVYGESKSPAFLEWTSKPAVKQAWAGVDEEPRSEQAIQCPLVTAEDWRLGTLKKPV